MRVLLVSLVILLYPILAFNTFHTFKFFSMNGYLSIEMFRRLDAADVRFVYLVFSFSSILISLYILMHQKISLMGFSYRLLIAIFIIISVFWSFYFSHKVFYHFDSLTLHQWVAKILTTSVPAIFIILVIQIVEKNYVLISNLLETSLLGIIPMIVATIIILGIEPVSIEKASILCLGAVLGLWTALNLMKIEQSIVYALLPLSLGGFQLLCSGVLFVRYWKS